MEGVCLVQTPAALHLMVGEGGIERERAGSSGGI